MSSEFLAWIGPLSAWVAAGFSVACAILGIWWPWHTRLESDLVDEQSWPVGRFTKQMFGHLLLSCNLARPFCFMRICNEGELPAHQLRVVCGSDEYTAKLLVFDPEDFRGFDLPKRVGLLRPGQSLYIMFLPTTGHVVDQPQCHLEWKEEPLRLAGSRRTRPIRYPGRLEAKRPLYREEVKYARTAAEDGAAKHSNGFDAYVRQVLRRRVDEFDPANASPAPLV